jgi:hypothetical protein
MRRSSTARSISCLLLAAAAAAQEPPAKPTRPRDLFGPGWRWELAPTKLSDGWSPTGETQPKQWTSQGESRFVPSGLVSLVLTAGNRPVFVHIRSNPGKQQEGSAVTDYRPVLLTADGTPVFASITMSSGRNDLAETRYLFQETKDAGAIASFALAKLDLAGKRERAQEGADRAKTLGASVLPLPVVGEPLAFDLPTIDGGHFASKDQLGKVVVIDCWATW